MPAETNFWLSSVTQRETNAAGGNDFDTLIRFRLFKLTRNCSHIEAPQPIVDDEAYKVMENQAAVLTSSFKQLKYRPHYRQFMAQILSGMDVPEQEHAAIVDKIFEVVKVAVPGLPILVGLGDVTVHFRDNTSTASNISSEDATVQRFLDDLPGIIDWLTLRDLMDENTYDPIIPASESSIDGLEKVRLDSLEEANVERAPICSICMEDLDQYQGITRLPCSHIYHGVCIAQWLKRNHLCPMCRKPIEEGGKPSKGLWHWPTMLMIISALGITTVALLCGKLSTDKIKVSSQKRKSI